MCTVFICTNEIQLVVLCLLWSFELKYHMTVYPWYESTIKVHTQNGNWSSTMKIHVSYLSATNCACMCNNLCICVCYLFCLLTYCSLRIGWSVDRDNSNAKVIGTLQYVYLVTCLMWTTSFAISNNHESLRVSSSIICKYKRGRKRFVNHYESKCASAQV